MIQINLYYLYFASIQFVIIMNTINTLMTNLTILFEREHINVLPEGRLALTEFIHSYTNTLISKCIFAGSLKQKKLNKKEIIAIYDSQTLISPPSVAADLLQRRQKTIHAANLNRLDDYEFKDSLSISIDKVNLLDGIQSIRLKKFNSVHLMITKNMQLLIQPKNMVIGSNTSHFCSKNRKEVDSQQQMHLSAINKSSINRREQKRLKKDQIQYQLSDYEASSYSNESESNEGDSSQVESAS